MSLFGGDGSYEATPTPEHESPPSSTFTDPAYAASSSSPIVIASQDLPDGQKTTYSTYDRYDTYDPDDEMDEDYVDESEHEALSAQNSRPNRFTGKASTWRDYTAADRIIATTLDRQDAVDLSAHLYNAHALKRRVRLPSERLVGISNLRGRDDWLKKGEELDFVDSAGDLQRELVPSKRWTAWPLPPSEISLTTVANRGRRGGTERVAARRAGKDLRDEVFAVFLRLAKEQFMAREDDGGAVAGSDSQSRSPSRNRSESPTSVGSSQSPGDANLKSDNEVATTSDSENEFAPMGSGKQDLKPAVLTDDEYARRILDPSINSLLTRIDRLSADIRRTRINHFGRGDYSERSSSRSVSRSRSQRTPAPARKSTPRSSSRAASAKRRKVSKSVEVNPDTGNESESGSDYRAGIKSKETSDDDDMNSPPSKRNGGYPGSSRQSSVASTDRRAREGLMDWSEVLGIASMGGFNERVIARTAQRCATLFGESMTFHSLYDNITKEPNKPRWRTLEFTPSTIHAPDILTYSDSAPQSRPFFPNGTLSCPHPGCYGNKKQFPIPYRVIEHVKRVHKYDPRTNSSDNDDRNARPIYLRTIAVTGRRPGRSKSKSIGPTSPQNKKLKRDETEGAESAKGDWG